MDFSKDGEFYLKVDILTHHPATEVDWIMLKLKSDRLNDTKNTCEHITHICYKNIYSIIVNKKLLKIFLQYSWDSEPHKKWVLELANRLTSDGVDLCFDRYDLKVGSNNLHFMEQIESSQKVILIMSSGYKIKADARSGGIGYEYQIMSSEIAAELASNQKFIPILRDGNPEISIPRILRPFLYLDMREDKRFEQQYLELLHLIYDEPMIIKPKLGKKPLLGQMLTSSKKTEQQRQLEISKRVHDIVANRLYQVMAKIEGSIETDREQILDSIEDIYERSRDISYDRSEFIEPEFHETLNKLLRSFADEKTSVLLSGNTSAIWSGVGKSTQYQIKTIMQELMINMKKHSKGTAVSWRFERAGERIRVLYSDNGIGMKKGQSFKNGLNNVINQLDAIGGNIDFDLGEENGQTIDFSFPSSTSQINKEWNRSSKHSNAQIEWSEIDIMIITLLSQGVAQKNMPKILQSKNISPSGLSSIEKRLAHLKSRLSIHNNAQLVSYCKNHGII
ncbi:TIR domain-containing protein [Pedobacter sp. ISL-68]|uniref:TIR domain-containing protein n=1 Tax=unclassified Pedobacter TaxID=2628915 RepID=UPI001BEA1BF0|nr:MULTISPECIES: TIR domain-containing protein [unclassified Pedobacter]MBT2563762.1 TIR domain-containing protein [Pedobacter sp. ISL-64]MBT2589654.1 TIR domain-containing protein [Pedobacter sp. ISL-68]